MNFSKLTLVAPFLLLAQAVILNLAVTKKALCGATVLEQQEEGTLQGGDFSNKKSNLSGNKVNKSYRILSSDDDENQFIVKSRPMTTS